MNIVKILCVVAYSTFWVADSQAHATDHSNFFNPNPGLKRKLILKHVGQMSKDLKIRINSPVEKRIRYLTGRGRSHTEEVLGRSISYFPIFEAYLAAYQLPEELKYLPVIESALNLGAYSKAGAAGPWQFIRSTGRAYGLTVNSELDERMDVHKSSEAAAQLLVDLYKMFKDWPLALAAYNCGPTRVRKAINERRTKDFWKIRTLLPKETQEYVVRFMAISYVMSYYQFYDLRPAYPDYDLQYLKTIKVYGKNSLTNLAKESRISHKTLKKLNPSYRNDVIPANPYGNYVVFPKLALSPNFRSQENTVAVISN